MVLASGRWLGCVVLVCLVGCGEGRETPPPLEGMGCEAIAPAREGLVLAGSGSNLPLTRFLADRYREAHPGPWMEIPESIGTHGAARAVHDGVIDLGLASRGLKASEREMGVVATPLARSILAPVVHARHGEVSLTRAQLIGIYTGAVTRWPDGRPARPLLREVGDSGAAAIEREAPALFAAMEQARREGRGLVLHTDQEMIEALLNVEGAVGWLDVGMIGFEALPLRPLGLDGVSPGVAEARDGRWPFIKTLWWLTMGPPQGAVADFLAFTQRPEVVEAVLERGYLEAR